MASMPSVPLSRLRPSLACRVRGTRPCSASTSAAGRSRPSWRRNPSPIRGSARWAKGARSPEAPTEPCAGTTGSRSRRSRSRRRATISTRTPEWPCARVRARSSSIARTSGSGSGGPHPGGVAAQQGHLGLVGQGGVDAGVGQGAEAGGDPVDHPALPNRLLHHGAGRRHAGRHPGPEAHLGPPLGDGHHLLGAQGVAGEQHLFRHSAPPAEPPAPRARPARATGAGYRPGRGLPGRARPSRPGGAGWPCRWLRCRPRSPPCTPGPPSPSRPCRAVQKVAMPAAGTSAASRVKAPVSVTTQSDLAQQGRRRGVWRGGRQIDDELERGRVARPEHRPAEVDGDGGGEAGGVDPDPRQHRPRWSRRWCCATPPPTPRPGSSPGSRGRPPGLPWWWRPPPSSRWPPRSWSEPPWWWPLRRPRRPKRVGRARAAAGIRRRMTPLLPSLRERYDDAEARRASSTSVESRPAGVLPPPSRLLSTTPG